MKNSRPECAACNDSGQLLLEMHERLYPFAQDYGYDLKSSANCFCSRGQQRRSFFGASDNDKERGRQCFTEQDQGRWYRIVWQYREDTFGGKSYAQWQAEKNATDEPIQESKPDWKPYKENDLEDLPF